MLPQSDLGREDVTLSGGVISVRGLSAAEMTAVGKLAGADQNVLSIAYATGEPHADVKAWYHAETTSAADVMLLTDVIARLSGMDRGARFQGATGNDVVVQRPGT